jgi:chorismate synthase
MAANFFGNIFRITTFGESHGPGIGVVIDGCPAGLSLTEEDINEQLALRRPGRNLYTSPRAEEDSAEILSGVFQGKTTGAPIAIFVRNRDADSSQYESLKNMYRPGHANFTYLQKYGIFDFRGGGRASARETVARVAAGAVAKKILKSHEISSSAFLAEMGGIAIDPPNFSDVDVLKKKTYASPLFCPDDGAAEKMSQKLSEIIREGDSLGGVVSCVAHIPVGLGDPVYYKLEAMLAFAMLSLPASKGFEIGQGFHAAEMRGSLHNDPFVASGGEIETASNFAGGTLGGISTGMPLFFSVAFKPTSSIQQPQPTVDINGRAAILELSKRSRHDPCVAIRAVPVVEAMADIVLVDALLMNRSAKL